MKTKQKKYQNFNFYRTLTKNRSYGQQQKNKISFIMKTNKNTKMKKMKTKQIKLFIFKNKT